MVARNDIQPLDLRTEWERALGHPLTPTEYEEIKDNLRAFFSLLHEWDQKKREREGSVPDHSPEQKQPGGDSL
jgi:hypothetical protein